MFVKEKTRVNKANKEMIDIKKKLKNIDEKDAEVEELKKANAVLEEKITSLLDVLYSCKDCG